MILAFDTSLADLHIGLFSDDGSSLGEYHHKSSPEERHLFDALLAQKTSELLEAASRSAKDISIITFINGPGSFTGLRIGLAFAKGMAFGSGAKLVPLIAHSVLLEEYRETRHGASLQNRIAILYPGYEKDSVYMSFADEPTSIKYIAISELLKMDIIEVICPPELDHIFIPHHIVSIKLKTMAQMSMVDRQSSIVGKNDSEPSATSHRLSTLEPFYGTDFKTKVTGS